MLSPGNRDLVELFFILYTAVIAVPEQASDGSTGARGAGALGAERYVNHTSPWHRGP